MSYYDDERPRRQKSTRDRVRDDYDDATTYQNSRENVRTTSLVKRRSNSLDSVEEVRRDFSPPDGRGGYIRETTIRKSGIRPARTRSYETDRYDDDRYDDRSRAGGKRDSYYAGRDSRRPDDRRDRRRSKYNNYSDESSRSRSRTPPKKERRKSMPEEALEALGLGGVAAAVLGKKSRSRSKDRDRARSRSRAGGRRGSSSSGGGRRGKSRQREQLTQALKAAVLAGAGEAFRSRKESGGWGGEKGKRVLTAAFAAGGVDGLINTGKDPGEHSKLTTLGSAVTGIATNRIVNGSRSKSRGRPGSPDSYRDRSRSHGGIGDLAAGGTIAVAAKKAYDSIRGRSKSRDRERGRGRSRSSSYDSYDSRSPPRAQRSRSRSVAARGLAALGLNDAANRVDPTRRGAGGGGGGRRYSDEYADDRSRNAGYGYDDVGQPRSGPHDASGRSRSVGPSQGLRSPPPGGYKLDYGPHHNGDPDTDSSSDLGSSSDEEKDLKSNRRKQLVTAGLATVATIHAGHSLYESAEKRRSRKRAVRDGTISKEQAIKNRNRDRLQDAASVGLAALGVKGAYSEWQEMKESREEYHKEREKAKRHADKRAARRRKMSDLQRQGYLTSGYSNSSPSLYVPNNGSLQHYDGSGPYNVSYSPDPSMRQNPPPMQPHYYDDNPYAYANGNQYQPSPHNDTGIPPPPGGNPPR